MVHRRKHEKITLHTASSRHAYALKVLKNAMIADGVTRGLHGTAKVLDAKKAQVRMPCMPRILDVTEM